jgi:hypothetical protein
VLAIDVRHFELGIVTVLTAALTAISVPCGSPASAPAMPAPSPEPVAVRHTEVSAIACDEPGIQTIVLKGRVESLGEMSGTLHFRFAELPSGYAVMTLANGEFEVRIPRGELGITDLCSLPTAGRDAAFRDAQLSVEYALLFER